MRSKTKSEIYELVKKNDGLVVINDQLSITTINHDEGSVRFDVTTEERYKFTWWSHYDDDYYEAIYCEVKPLPNLAAFAKATSILADYLGIGLIIPAGMTIESVRSPQEEAAKTAEYEIRYKAEVDKNSIYKDLLDRKEIHITR